jgi:hypothetical protein
MRVVSICLSLGLGRAAFSCVSDVAIVVHRDRPGEPPLT